MTHRFAVTLRVAAMASKFALIFLLAKFLPVEQIGDYGLLTAFLGYFVLAVGFDFYTFTTREIIGVSGAARSNAIVSHFSFFALTYATVIPIALLIAKGGMLPSTLLTWFLVLLPLEHLGLELDRILIATLQQKSAAVSIFLRQGMVTFITIPLMWLAPVTRTLGTVLLIWVILDLLALILGVSFLFRLRLVSHLTTPSIPWIKKGIAIALPFLLGTLLLRAIFTFDRQFVLAADGREVLGVYSLYMGIAAGITQLVYVGVHQFRYPQLVDDVKSNDATSFRTTYKRMRAETVALCLISFFALVIGSRFVTSFYDDPVYGEYSWLLPAVAAAIVVYNLSLIPHYALYARSADRSILFVTTMSVTTFFLFNFLLVNHLGVMAVVCSIGAASLVLLIGKLIALKRLPSIEGQVSGVL